MLHLVSGTTILVLTTIVGILGSIWASDGEAIVRVLEPTRVRTPPDPKNPFAPPSDQ